MERLNSKNTKGLNRIIKKLDLQPHPEGGYFKETYRNSQTFSDRNLCTAIYYLITADSFSALHKVKSDEIFHFYAGDAVEMIQISPDGILSKITIGPDIAKTHQVQVLVPKDFWQGTKLKKAGKWALLGATVSRC